MEIVLLVCVLAPLGGALLLPAVGSRSPRARNGVSLALVLTALACSVVLATDAVRGTVATLRWELPMGFSLGFRADALAAFMAIASCMVAAIIVIYSFGYIERYPHQNEYYMLVTLFIGAMMGLVYGTSLLEIYTFWEISSVCCWRLIGFYRDQDVVRKGEKAYLITVAGALVMLAGFIGIYAETGTFELTAMRGVRLPDWTVVCILMGILSKSATFPLHSWLPDAGVAPSPVTSLLHAAVLVKIGVYVYARLFALTFDINPAFNLIVPIIAGVSALISAGAARRATDIKRVIAYSTVSQLGFILLGVSAGNAISLEGGLLYIMAHSIGKGGLFLCAGIVEHTLHTKDMNSMGGLIKTMPWTAAAFLLCALSIMGIPPFGRFFAKFLVIEGVMFAGHIGVGLVFIAGAVMTVLYLTRFFYKVFLGPVVGKNHAEGTRGMVICVMGLGVLSLLMGVLIHLPSALAALAVR